jgi:hypothetical protein
MLLVLGLKYLSAAAILTMLLLGQGCGRQPGVALIARTGENHLEVFLKRGRYVLQLKERNRPTIGFSVKGYIDYGKSPLDFSKTYLPSESHDGVMKVFEMPNDGRVTIHFAFEQQSTNSVFMTVGPYK